MLEFTESLLVDDMEETITKMNALRAHGGGFSLDDFGTGYSSLSYLKRFPLDTLKIDRAFISDAVSNPDDATLTVTIINLAHSMRLKVVGEGDYMWSKDKEGSGKNKSFTGAFGLMLFY